MPPKRIKCSFNECKLAAQRISGDCAFCNGHYCSNHRLLEDHKCQNLEDVSNSTSGSDPNLKEPQWWLVGLSDVLSDDSFADLFRSGSGRMISAKRKPLSKTQCSSTRSAPRSSRVSNNHNDKRSRFDRDRRRRRRIRNDTKKPGGSDSQFVMNDMENKTWHIGNTTASVVADLTTTPTTPTTLAGLAPPPLPLVTPSQRRRRQRRREQKRRLRQQQEHQHGSTSFSPLPMPRSVERQKITVATN